VIFLIFIYRSLPICNASNESGFGKFSIYVKAVTSCSTISCGKFVAPILPSPPIDFDLFEKIGERFSEKNITMYNYYQSETKVKQMYMYTTLSENPFMSV
jgi:hypothetical protein